MAEDRAERVRGWLETLCLQYPDRHVGGAGVAAANELFGDVVEAAGWELERLPFDCVDWQHGDARLNADGHEWQLHVGPYSPPYSGTGRLVSATTLAELEALTAEGECILFLHGEVASEQITPRNYPFYQMDAHARVLSAIDRIAPAAIIAATDTTSMAAAIRPFPLFEDGDLGFPSAYLLVDEAVDLPLYVGEEVRLEIDSEQSPSWSEQLVARLRGGRADRIAVSAHVDSRFGTPGALDNATGVCVLMTLAEMLGDSLPSLPAVGVELLPFNGEDNFGAYGEMRYLHACGDRLAKITLAINIDAAGRRGDDSAVSFYECGDDLKSRVLQHLDEHPRVVEGPSWPMSDHMVFAMRGVPAVAITSTGFDSILSEVAHTTRDLPELVDPELVVSIAAFIADLVRTM